jgi:hypothetical protein
MAQLASVVRVHAHAREESRAAPNFEDFLDNMRDIYV